MPLTLSDGVTTLGLPGGLQWPDRDWSPLAGSVSEDFTGDGQLVLDTWPAKQAGRPITLESGGNFAYLSAAQVQQLRTWAALRAQELTLSGLRGEPDYRVVFRHQASSGALTTAPIDPDNNGHAAAYWRGTLRLTVLGVAA